MAGGAAWCWGSLLLLLLLLLLALPGPAWLISFYFLHIYLLALEAREGEYPNTVIPRGRCAGRRGNNRCKNAGPFNFSGNITL